MGWAGGPYAGAPTLAYFPRGPKATQGHAARHPGAKARADQPPPEVNYCLSQAQLLVTRVAGQPLVGPAVLALPLVSRLSADVGESEGSCLAILT